MKFRFFVIILLLLSVLGCARRGNPSGGPKDESEPILIRTIPEFKSIQFNEKEIKIYFDEYIKLKDLQKHLVVSPPLKYPAIVTPLGTPSKKITISIQDTLLKNTTYTFNFGESIIDNSEGNILSNFKYIFSTGSYIDSLSIQGVITDAFSKKKNEYISVFLYPADTTFNDSTIYKEKPLYVANTLDSIGWKIDNIKQGKYHLIAIKDENKNYLFDAKKDKIGYIDSIITIPIEKKITVKLFQEELPFKLINGLEVSKGHVVFGYEGNVNKLNIKPIQKNIKYTTTFDKKKDSVHFYYKTDKKLDSLQFVLTTGNVKEEKTVKLRSKVEMDSLKITSNLRGILHLADTLIIMGNNPLEKIDKKGIYFVDKDSVKVTYVIAKKGKQIKFIFDKKEEQNYQLRLLPKTITDFFGQQQKDTLNYTFRTKRKDNYGSISLNITGVKKQIIVQLLTDKEEIVQEKISTENKIVEFNLLKPAKYTIRIITDSNANKKWDTGNYRSKLQPEKVIYFNGEINVKENWFVKEAIDLK